MESALRALCPPSPSSAHHGAPHHARGWRGGEAPEQEQLRATTIVTRVIRVLKAALRLWWHLPHHAAESGLPQQAAPLNDGTSIGRVLGPDLYITQSSALLATFETLLALPHFVAADPIRELLRSVPLTHRVREALQVGDGCVRHRGCSLECVCMCV